MTTYSFRPDRFVAFPIAIAIVMLVAHVADAQLSPAARSVLSASGRVGASVIAGLEEATTVRVMIAFDLPGGRRAVDLDLESRNAAIASARAAVLAPLAAADFELERSFASINAVAGNLTAAGALRLLDDPGVVRIDLDEGGTATLAQALPLMNIDVVRSMGFTGTGISVAVLDSGYDTDHPDLSDDLIDERCFCSGGGGCCPGGGTTQSGAGAAEDANGHGTNVAGIITSKGTVAPEGGAPDAEIVAIRVLDSGGSFCCSSDVVAGLDYIINNRPDVDVVNMSLGTTALFAGDCDGAAAFTMSYATAIDTLRANGVITFAASGNQGSATTMAAPACVANTVSVGAVWDSNLGSQTLLGCTDSTTAADKPTCFSNSNSVTDLFAAGAYTLSTGMGGGTSSFGGTSQASPAAAACAVALLDAVPAATPAELESALEASSTIVTDAKNGLGFPRVDCSESLDILQICPATPAGGCLGGLKAAFQAKDNADDAKDQIKWKLVKGDAFAQGATGDPLSTTEYALCIYDESGGVPSLAGTLRIAPNANWQDKTPKGWRYKDKLGAEDGVTKVQLKAGDAGKTKVQVKAKGSTAGWPVPVGASVYFDQDTRVTVQLHASDQPTCWTTEFTAAGTKKNDGSQFKAKSP